MYFGKFIILAVLVACLTMNTMAAKRRTMKTKIKKVNLQNVVAPQCGCQNPLVDIINCGCRGPIIEPALAPISPFEIALPGCASPVIDVPNYRYADPIELNPLGCLFPSIEIPNYGVISAPISLPTVEYFTAVDLPCGCPGPKCGCRTPAVKLPTCPREYAIEASLPLPYGAVAIELPSYAPGPVIQVPGCRGPGCNCQGPCSCAGVPVSTCGCRGPCSCPEYQILSCGCQGSCSCAGIPVNTCGCQGPCSCAGIPASACGCQGPCSCAGIPASACGCQGPCGCAGIPASACGCQGPCGCAGIPVSACGCQGPCGCAGVSLSCGCQGPCGCTGIQLPLLPGLLPAVELPACGCGCGVPGCNCGPYLRQVTLQPPFL